MAELAWDISCTIEMNEAPLEDYAPSGLPAGIRSRVLRRIKESGVLRSVILEIPAGWTSEVSLAGSADEQGYVLTGDFSVGDMKFGTRGFYFYAAGQLRGAMHSESGAKVVLILGGAQSFGTEGKTPRLPAVEYADAFDVEPFEPEINGIKTGTSRRVLWEDPENGADTRYLVVPGGFEGRGANWHLVHEEILCLEGDIAPDDTRPLRTNTYLHNPAYAVHGFHEHSNHGAHVLEWHDGKWAFNMYDEKTDTRVDK